MVVAVVQLALYSVDLERVELALSLSLQSQVTLSSSLRLRLSACSRLSLADSDGS